MDKGFSEYLALYTSSPRDLSGEDFTLKATIIDRAGNERKTLRFPLEFNGGSMKPLPKDMEKELNQRIGIIDIELFIPD
jgi:hypothetical protein